jgi:hypothetical protein
MDLPYRSGALRLLAVLDPGCRRAGAAAPGNGTWEGSMAEPLTIRIDNLR